MLGSASIQLLVEEDDPRQKLARLIQKRHGLKVVLPMLGDSIEL